MCFECILESIFKSNGLLAIEKYIKLMRTANPVVIPRNHKVEEVLNEANNDNTEPLNKFLEILKNPYSDQKNIKDFQLPSSSKEKYQTFCGT